MSELYKLPDGWEWKTIEDLCEILDRLRKPISQKDRISGQFPYYGASGILDYINNYIFDERLLLIGEDGAKWGANENTAFIADGKYWVNNHAHIMRPNKNLVLDSLLVYYLNAVSLDEYITGATVKKLNQEKLKSIKIPLPPLSEQQRIVSKLDLLFAKIDKSIELHQKNMDEADAFMGSVLNEVFGELEEKYPLKKVSDGLKNILTGTTPPKNEQKYYENPSINWFSPSDFGKSKVLSDSKNMINPIALNDKKAKMYEKDTLLLVAIGATIGKIGVIREESSSNQQITAMKFKDDIDVDFSYYWFYYIKQTIINTASAATLPIINQNGIKDLKFIIPPIEIQQKIVAYLDAVSEKMERVKSIQKEKMESLKALKASILDKAFRGEL